MFQIFSSQSPENGSVGRCTTVPLNEISTPNFGCKEHACHQHMDLFKNLQKFISKNPESSMVLRTLRVLL